MVPACGCRVSTIGRGAPSARPAGVWGAFGSTSGVIAIAVVNNDLTPTNPVGEDYWFFAALARRASMSKPNITGTSGSLASSSHGS